MKKIIQTKNAPAPIGPYNQAVMTGDMLFISGQIAINPENEKPKNNSSAFFIFILFQINPFFVLLL
mgnify:CR=1 FL=1